MQIYHINLREAEQKQIEKHMRSKKASMQSKKRAQILRDLDESR